MYSTDPYANNAVMQIYMVIGIGSIVFFFIGVCALLCCCQKRFRGMERKGYVVREAEPRVPLIQPQVVNNPAMVPGFYPIQAPQFAPAIPNPYDQSPYDPQQPQAPPPYDLPAKY